MDVSDVYIRMCDCVEVQGQWDIEDGDFAFHCKDRDVYVVDIDIMVNCNQATGDTWLPRQNQIQNMLGEPFPFIADYFSAWVDDHREEHQNGVLIKTSCTSMEQFWLAFYMHEKHSKMWDGKKWVAIEMDIEDKLQ